MQTESSFSDFLAGMRGPAQVALLKTALVLAFFMLLRWAVMWVIFRRTADVRVRYYAVKTTTYVVALLALLVIFQIWFPRPPELSTFLGLLSAGLAIALKDLISSMAGWLYILLRRPFEVGDRIQIGEHAGDVIDLRLFRFTLLEVGNWVAADQSTGRVIHVPNSRVLTDVVANYTKGFSYIWNEIPVLITFESNWRKAKQILQQIGEKHGSSLTESAMEEVRKAARRAMIFYATLTPRVWTSVADSGVLLTLRYLCDPRQRRSSAEVIWEEILKEFGEADDIDFAYPTVRYYSNPVEGKAGTGRQEGAPRPP